MKLESTRLVARTLFPKTSPQRSNQTTSKISVLVPETKKTSGIRSEARALRRIGAILVKRMRLLRNNDVQLQRDAQIICPMFFRVLTAASMTLAVSGRVAALPADGPPSLGPSGHP